MRIEDIKARVKESEEIAFQRKRTLPGTTWGGFRIPPRTEQLFTTTEIQIMPTSGKGWLMDLTFTTVEGKRVTLSEVDNLLSDRLGLNLDFLRVTPEISFIHSSPGFALRLRVVTAKELGTTSYVTFTQIRL